MNEARRSAAWAHRFSTTHLTRVALVPSVLMSQPTSTGVQAHRGAEKLEQDTKGESGLPQPAVHSQRPNKRVLHLSLIHI